jgi:hypothetical protein
MKHSAALAQSALEAFVKDHKVHVFCQRQQRVFGILDSVGIVD